MLKAALALALSAALYHPTTILEKYGSLAVETTYPADGAATSQGTWDLHPKKGYYLSINVRGYDRGGDVDCYLLDSKHQIFTQDETSANRCSFGFYSDGQPLRLWIRNQGVRPTSYSVKVSQ